MTTPENPPMVSPQLSCDHHYIAYHQGDFPKAVYWVRICQFCRHIIPKINADLTVVDITDGALIAALGDAIELHQIEYIDSEVGYDCLCNEQGDVEWPRDDNESPDHSYIDYSSARKHVTRAILAALRGES